MSTTPADAAPHESRLDRELRALLLQRPVAALGTLDDTGAPAVSMVSFALDSEDAALLLHVSGLAAHTRQMQRDPRVSLMVLGADDAAESPQALPRVSIAAQARFVEPGNEEAQRCCAIYLARHPQAELMTRLPDFRFIRLLPTSVRHVAGFGAARSLEPADLQTLLRLP